MPGPLQGDGQLALVPGARAGLATRLDLRPLRQVAAEAVDLLVVDLDGLVGAERADLPAAPVAVVVVALVGAGAGGMRSGRLRWSVRREGRRGRVVGRCRRRGRRGGPAGGRAGRAGAGRPRLAAELAVLARALPRGSTTLSAVISRDVRFWPSRPSNSRVLKRPSTNTWLPLRRFSAARSARSPQTLTRNQSVSSTHSPVCWFLRALVDRDVELGHGPAVGRVAHLRDPRPGSR